MSDAPGDDLHPIADASGASDAAAAASSPTHSSPEAGEAERPPHAPADGGDSSGGGAHQADPVQGEIPAGDQPAVNSFIDSAAPAVGRGAVLPVSRWEHEESPNEEGRDQAGRETDRAPSSGDGDSPSSGSAKAASSPVETVASGGADSRATTSSSGCRPQPLPPPAHHPSDDAKGHDDTQGGDGEGSHQHLTDEASDGGSSGPQRRGEGSSSVGGGGGRGSGVRRTRYVEMDAAYSYLWDKEVRELRNGIKEAVKMLMLMSADNAMLQANNRVYRAVLKGMFKELEQAKVANHQRNVTAQQLHVAKARIKKEQELAEAVKREAAEQREERERIQKAFKEAAFENDTRELEEEVEKLRTENEVLRQLLQIADSHDGLGCPVGSISGHIASALAHPGTQHTPFHAAYLGAEPNTGGPPQAAAAAAAGAAGEVGPIGIGGFPLGLRGVGLGGGDGEVPALPSKVRELLAAFEEREVLEREAFRASQREATLQARETQAQAQFLQAIAMDPTHFQLHMDALKPETAEILNHLAMTYHSQQGALASHPATAGRSIPHPAAHPPDEPPSATHRDLRRGLNNRSRHSLEEASSAHQPSSSAVAAAAVAAAAAASASVAVAAASANPSPGSPSSVSVGVVPPHLRSPQQPIPRPSGGPPTSEDEIHDVPLPPRSERYAEDAYEGHEDHGQDEGEEDDEALRRMAAARSMAREHEAAMHAEMPRDVEMAELRQGRYAFSNREEFAAMVAHLHSNGVLPHIREVPQGPPDGEGLPPGRSARWTDDGDQHDQDEDDDEDDQHAQYASGDGRRTRPAPFLSVSNSVPPHSSPHLGPSSSAALDPSSIAMSLISLDGGHTDAPQDTEPSHTTDDSSSVKAAAVSVSVSFPPAAEPAYPNGRAHTSDVAMERSQASLHLPQHPLYAPPTAAGHDQDHHSGEHDYDRDQDQEERHPFDAQHFHHQHHQQQQRRSVDAHRDRGDRGGARPVPPLQLDMAADDQHIIIGMGEDEEELDNTSEVTEVPIASAADDRDEEALPDDHQPFHSLSLSSPSPARPEATEPLPAAAAAAGASACDEWSQHRPRFNGHQEGLGHDTQPEGGGGPTIDRMAVVSPAKGPTSTSSTSSTSSAASVIQPQRRSFPGRSTVTMGMSASDYHNASIAARMSTPVVVTPPPAAASCSSSSSSGTIDKTHRTLPAPPSAPPSSSSVSGGNGVVAPAAAILLRGAGAVPLGACRVDPHHGDSHSSHGGGSGNNGGGVTSNGSHSHSTSESKCVRSPQADGTRKDEGE
ncbi:unnamed protein product [Vitrella brassicaformis CCMP3155]|uniref:Uncharacterized protein n=3 Tax=Vitrella brassicaformis TaxID=1169539 RepID=A0A0G4EPW4_VITBC|nr:unnamed protein product [Vitrella brassicaformis CCMP3155]|eukprot:CEL99628.1 unnamed protein product [Vitrella brassicaformis CCMP3155]